MAYSILDPRTRIPSTRNPYMVVNPNPSQWAPDTGWVYPDYNSAAKGSAWEAEQNRRARNAAWVNSPEGKEQAALDAISNDPMRRYVPFTPTPTPGFGEPVENLMASLKAGSSYGSGADWSKMLKDAMAQNEASYRRVSGSTDPTRYFADMNAANAGFERAGRTIFDNQWNLIPEMEASNARYMSNVGGTDAALEAALRSNISRQYGLLPEFDAAQQAIMDAAVAAGNKAYNRFGKVTSGTPTSVGSGDVRAYNDIAARYMVPFQQARIAKRYDILGNEIPIEQSIAAANRSRYGQGLALEQGVTGRKFDLYGNQLPFEQAVADRARTQSMYQLDTALKLAQTDQSAALQFMQSLALPAQVQQQILSGQIQNAAQLAALVSAVRPTYWQDIIGAQPSQSAAYWARAPRYPQPQYGSGGGYDFGAGSGTTTATNGPAPMTIAQMDAANTAAYNRWYGNPSVQNPWAPYTVQTETGPVTISSAGRPQGSGNGYVIGAGPDYSQYGPYVTDQQRYALGVENSVNNYFQ